MDFICLTLPKMTSIDLINGDDDDVIISESSFNVHFSDSLPLMTYGKLKNGFRREVVYLMVNKTADRIYAERNTTPPGKIVKLHFTPDHYRAEFAAS